MTARKWYAKRLSGRRYQVVCHSAGTEYHCGTTMPECSRDQLLDWLLVHSLPGEQFFINDTHKETHS